MPQKLKYVFGKPVKFMRFGGLSSVPQKGYNKEEGFHCPPTRRGIYAFTWPYIDLFLISCPEWSGLKSTHQKFEYVKDKEGNPICTGHPDYCKLLENDNNQIFENQETIYLVKRKHPKIFEYFGNIWHHLGKHLKPHQIITNKNSWSLSTYDNFVFALNKELHEYARTKFSNNGDKIIRQWQMSNNPVFGWVKDNLEVFIEHVH